MQKSNTGPLPLRNVCGALACTVLLASGSAVAAPITTTAVFNAFSAGPVSLPFGAGLTNVLVDVQLSASAQGTGTADITGGPFSFDVSVFVDFPSFSFDVIVTDSSGGNNLFNGENSFTASYDNASFTGAANGTLDLFGFTEDPSRPNDFAFGLGDTIDTITVGMTDYFLKIDADNTDADFSNIDPSGDPSDLSMFTIDALFTVDFAGAISTDITDPPFTVFLSGDSTLTGVVIPVPAAAWLFGSALAMLGWARRRQAT